MENSGIVYFLNKKMCSGFESKKSKLKIYRHFLSMIEKILEESKAETLVKKE